MKYFVTLVQGNTYNMASVEFVRGTEVEVSKPVHDYACRLPLFSCRCVDEGAPTTTEADLKPIPPEIIETDARGVLEVADLPPMEPKQAKTMSRSRK